METNEEAISNEYSRNLLLSVIKSKQNIKSIQIVLSNVNI